MIFSNNLPHLDTVLRLKMCNTSDVSGDVCKNVCRVCVVRTTYTYIPPQELLWKYFCANFDWHTSDRLCPAPTHTSFSVAWTFT